MVEEIRAYAAADGTVFKHFIDAAEHDAMKALIALDVFNHASATGIILHANVIAPILQQVVAARAAVEARINAQEPR